MELIDFFAKLSISKRLGGRQRRFDLTFLLPRFMLQNSPCLWLCPALSECSYFKPLWPTVGSVAVSGGAGSLDTPTPTPTPGYRSPLKHCSQAALQCDGEILNLTDHKFCIGNLIWTLWCFEIAVSQKRKEIFYICWSQNSRIVVWSVHARNSLACAGLHA